MTQKPKLNYEYITDSEGLQRVIAWAKDKKVIVVDSETSGLDCFLEKIILVQIGDSSKQWLIDARTVNITALKPLLEDKSITKVGVNLKFDYKFLRRAGIVIEPVYDIMLVEQVLRCGLQVSSSLAAMAEHYLDIQLDKSGEIRESFATTPPDEFTEEQLEYAALDVWCPLLIARKQKPIVKARGLMSTVNLENAVLPVIAEMDLEGLKLDVRAWKKLYQQSVEEVQKAELALDKEFGVSKLVQDNLFGSSDIIKPINYNSWQQVLKAIKKKGHTLESTDKKVVALAAIHGAVPVPLAQALLSYRMHSKLVSSYGESFLKAIHPVTGHIHTDFTQATTTTGRLRSGQSKSESDDKIPKVNLQNIPRDKKYRACFVPDDGYVFIIYDYSAIEPRVVGELSHDPTYVRAFTNGEDIYAAIGTPIYKEEVSKTPGRPSELRDKTKIGLLGTSYGTGKQKFYRKMLVDLNLSKDGHLNDKIVHIDRAESDALWEGIFEACPLIRPTLDNLSSLASPETSARKIFDDRANTEPYRTAFMRSVACLEKRDMGLKKGEINHKASLMAKSVGYVTYAEAIGGRKRFFKVYNDSYYTQGRNTPIQGTAASIIKYAMVLIHNEIRKRNHDAVIAVQVHDELIVKARKEIADEVAEYVKDLMIKAGNQYLKTIPCVVEGGIADKWEKQ